MGKSALGWLAAAGLAACLAVSVLHFLGVLPRPGYEHGLAAASLCWFACATAWTAGRR